MAMLKPGTRLQEGTGRQVVVDTLLGAGGQGEVYRVHIDQETYALKWYFPQRGAQAEWLVEQREALESYLLRTPPPDSRFLWPLGVVDDPHGRTYGYLMEVLPPRYQGLELLVLGRMRPVPTFKVLCRAAVNLAECFRKLHNMGACYKDINLGGPVLDPETGDILICDNDNVRVNKTPGNVIFAYFAAPELLRGEGMCQTNTDIHSLAVLLFYMFVRHHPLEGARELQLNVFNTAAQRKFYGKHPLFIYDPDDDSNRPVKGFHDPAIRNWKLYPGFLKDLFTRAFTVGLHQPGRRVREGEWMEAFSRLEDVRFHCQNCGAENFLDPDRDEDHQCWRCGRTTPMPASLELPRRSVLLNHDRVLYPHHLGHRLDFTQPVAAVSQHPEDPSRWGLTNLTQTPWTYEGRDGQPRTVDPERTVPLRSGLAIRFGSVTGTVRK